MIKEIINKISNSKIFWIIFSVLASITLWLYVAYTENTEIESTISNVPVQFVGEDTLTGRNLMVTEGDDQTVTLRVTARRSDISKLNASTLSVSVDLSKVKTTGEMGMAYTINYPDNVNQSNVSISRTSYYVYITVDKLVTKNVDVRGTFEGDILDADKYLAQPLIFDPETIEISGPDAIISQISYVWVVLQRENVSATVTATLSYTFMDNDGNEVKSDDIKCSVETVEVTMPVLMVKEIPLSVDFIEGGGASAEDVVYTINPKTIKLSGAAETLDGINHIVLGSIDLSDFVSTTTQPFQIIIPNDTTNITGETEATVTAEIVGLETAKLSVSSFEFTNTPNGYLARAVTQSLEVKVRAPRSVINLITSYNIRAVADLTDLTGTTGTFIVPLKVSIDGYSDAGVVGDYEIVVVIEIPTEGGG